MIFSNNGIIGCDISYGQGYPPLFPVTDFDVMTRYGMRFVIQKAGQKNYVDPSFKYNWPAAKGKLPRHSYWFYDNEENPKRQAEKYWEIMEPDMEGMLWLDLEDKGIGDFSVALYWYDFLERLKAKSGLKSDGIGIYTGIDYWKTKTSGLSAADKLYFKQYKIWLANYRDDPFEPDFHNIILPYPFESEDILMLQSGTPTIGKLCGVSSYELDYNIFNGDEAKFARYFPFNSQPPIPPLGDPSMYSGNAKTTLTKNVNVRIGFPDGTPNPNGEVVASIMPGQAWEGSDRKLDVNKTAWILITKIGSKTLTDVSGNPRPAWSAEFLLDVKVVPAPTPEPNPSPNPKPPATITNTYDFEGYAISDVSFQGNTVTIKLNPK